VLEFTKVGPSGVDHVLFLVTIVEVVDR